MTGNIDLFIGDLRRHLEILDVEIADITTKISASSDPEGDGYYDRGEYFMGAGFVAVQKYLLETFCLLKVKQVKALDAGPKLTGDVSFANIIWSAANYWKHDAEWWKGAIEWGPQDSDRMHKIEISWPTDKQAKRNVAYLGKFGKLGRDYICSNVLAEFVDNLEEIRLQSLLPYLVTWRADVERKIEMPT